MNAVIKMLIGVLVFLGGIYWYAGPILGHFSGDPLFGIRTTYAFAILFSGLFGLAMIFFGFIIAWVEYEDIKWNRKEKQSKK